MCKEEKNLSQSPCETHTCFLPEETSMVRAYAEESPEIIRDEIAQTIVAKDSKQTLVVNLFAGPGAGKSTTAAGVFFELKSRGVNCELAGREERHRTFTDQIYIFGKQYHRIHRLLGQVQCIITDSPILLTPVYDGEKRKSLETLVVEEHKKMWTYNAFLKRRKTFNPKGRNHSLDESQALDCLIGDMLDKHQIPFETFEGTPEGKDAIVRKVLMLLDWDRV